MKEDTYKCAVCGNEYKKVLTDKEARDQFEREFPGFEYVPDQPTVCDTCFRSNPAMSDDLLLGGAPKDSMIEAMAKAYADYLEDLLLNGIPAYSSKCMGIVFEGVGNITFPNLEGPDMMKKIHNYCKPDEDT